MWWGEGMCLNTIDIPTSRSNKASPPQTMARWSILFFFEKVNEEELKSQVVFDGKNEVFWKNSRKHRFLIKERGEKEEKEMDGFFSSMRRAP